MAQISIHMISSISHNWRRNSITGRGMLINDIDTGS
jgi:hypothetical protein